MGSRSLGMGKRWWLRAMTWRQWDNQRNSLICRGWRWSRLFIQFLGLRHTNCRNLLRRSMSSILRRRRFLMERNDIFTRILTFWVTRCPGLAATILTSRFKNCIKVRRIGNTGLSGIINLVRWFCRGSLRCLRLLHIVLFTKVTGRFSSYSCMRRSRTWSETGSAATLVFLICVRTRSR